MILREWRRRLAHRARRLGGKESDSLVLRRFWQSLPWRSYLLFLAAVSSLFSALGFIDDIESFGLTSTPRLMVEVLLSGTIAATMLLGVTKDRKALFIALPLLAISFGMKGDEPFPVDLDDAALASIRRRLQIDAFGIAFGVIFAYACFIVFVAREGKRFLRVETEMALAREIHQVVAPRIERRLDRFEFFGASLPSSEVGGDLVDLVVREDGWIAYAADVSGHGVASGTLMAMFKSAARSQLMVRMAPEALLADLNQVIFDVKKPGMFITCACLVHHSEGTVRFTLAGHLPILHYRRARSAIDELSVAHLPLGMFEDQHYRTVPVHAERGDLFVLVTDGVTEVFDRRDEEFGLERLKAVVLEHEGRPLSELFDIVVGHARRHGPQTDDQSLLLVRCL